MVVLSSKNSVRYLALFLLFLCGCNPKGPFVVAYVSQDQVYAEPILKEFTARTGIHVRAVYDSEVVKTVGLINRLLAEKSRPQCDLLWNNEDLRPQMLLSGGVINSLTNFGFRTRRIVVNTNLTTIRDAPATFLDFTNSRYRGKIVMAYPLFGTTASHMVALKLSLGADVWTNWCRALVANGLLLVDGNSMVVQFVGRGDALFGITDFDDIKAGQRENLPVHAMPLGSECYYTRNTICLIEGSSRRQEAEQLKDFLTSEEVADRLIAAGALEGGPKPACSRPDSQNIYKAIPEAAQALQNIFGRGR